MKVTQVLRLLSMLLVGSSLLVAQPGSTQAPELGQRVISTIQAGEELSSLKIFHANFRQEGPGVGSLKGCDYAVQPLSRPEELHVDWVCPNSKHNAFTRIYLPGSKLSRIEFQPSLNLMAPTKVGQILVNLPSRKKINKQFVNAVKLGTDPTLGGLIPITPDHFRQLKKMKGWVVFKTNQSGDYGADTLWLDATKSPSMAADITLHFDQAGRPIGLWLDTSSLMVAIKSDGAS